MGADGLLLRICRRVPTTPDRLRKVRGTEQALFRVASLDAIKRGQKMPADQCQKFEHHAHPSAVLKVLLSFYVCLSIVHKEGIASPFDCQ